MGAITISKERLQEYEAWEKEMDEERAIIDALVHDECSKIVDGREEEIPPFDEGYIVKIAALITNCAGTKDIQFSYLLEDAFLEGAQMYQGDLAEHYPYIPQLSYYELMPQTPLEFAQKFAINGIGCKELYLPLLYIQTYLKGQNELHDLVKQHIPDDIKKNYHTLFDYMGKSKYFSLIPYDSDVWDLYDAYGVRDELVLLYGMKIYSILHPNEKLDYPSVDLDVIFDELGDRGLLEGFTKDMFMVDSQEEDVQTLLKRLPNAKAPDIRDVNWEALESYYIYTSIDSTYENYRKGAHFHSRYLLEIKEKVLPSLGSTKSVGCFALCFKKVRCFDWKGNEDLSDIEWIRFFINMLGISGINPDTYKPNQYFTTMKGFIEKHPIMEKLMNDKFIKD